MKYYLLLLSFVFFNISFAQKKELKKANDTINKNENELNEVVISGTLKAVKRLESACSS